MASGACDGSINGSVMRPLAKSVVVHFKTDIAQATNPELVQRFVSGLESSGVAVAPAGHGNTLLDMTFAVRSGAAGDNGPRPGSYKNLSWVSGTAAPGTDRWVLRGSTVNVSILARDSAKQGLAWVGTLKCSVTTDDPGDLAQYLGTVVGRSLGKAERDSRL
jgi:hypothetical protein